MKPRRAPRRGQTTASGAYTIGVREICLPKAQIGFVSSNSFDVMGSANFGFPTSWVNRTGESLDKLGPVPDLVIPDRERLAEALGA